MYPTICTCAYCRLGEHLITQFERNQGDGKFENISLDEDSRPTSLIRRYENIYSDERVELLDVLEQSGQGQGVDLEQCRTELSAKTRQQAEQQLPLSIIVVSSVCLLIIITTRSTGTVHTSAKAHLTSVAIRTRIRIPDSDRHQN